MKYVNELSYLSAPKRTRLSPFFSSLLRKGIINDRISVLDYGCGYGSDVKILQTKGFNIEGYDPHYFPKFPTKKYDIVVCQYVLDVITDNTDRMKIIKKAWGLCKDKLFKENIIISINTAD